MKIRDVDMHSNLDSPRRPPNLLPSTQEYHSTQVMPHTSTFYTEISQILSTLPYETDTFKVHTHG